MSTPRQERVDGAKNSTISDIWDGIYKRIAPEAYSYQHYRVAVDFFREGKHDEAIAALQKISVQKILTDALGVILYDGWYGLVIVWKRNNFSEDLGALIERYLDVAPAPYRREVHTGMDAMKTDAALSGTMSREEYIERQRTSARNRAAEIVADTKMTPERKDEALAGVAFRMYGAELIDDAVEIINQISNEQYRDTVLARFAVARFSDMGNKLTRFDSLVQKIKSVDVRDDAYIEISQYYTYDEMGLIRERLSGQPAIDRLYSFQARRFTGKWVSRREPENIGIANAAVDKIENTDERDSTIATMLTYLCNGSLVPTEVVPLLVKISWARRDDACLGVVAALYENRRHWRYSNIEKRDREQVNLKIFELAQKITQLIGDDGKKSKAEGLSKKIKTMKPAH